MRAFAPMFALVLLACPPAPRADRPEEAYLAFTQALQRGNAKGAWELLSTPTRKAFQTQAKEISRASGGAVSADPMRLAFAVPGKAPVVTEVKAVQVEGDEATVAVTAGGRTQEQRMVKEGASWKVDLQAALTQ